MPEEYLVDLEAYQRQLDAINIEFDGKIGQLNYQISVLNGEIASLEGQISSWGGKVDTAQSRVNQLTKEIGDLETELSIWRDRKSKAHALGYKLQTQPSTKYYDNSRYVKPAYEDCIASWGDYITKSYMQSWRANQLVEVPVWFDSVVAYRLGYDYKDYYALVYVADGEIFALENELGGKRSDLFSAQADLSYYKSQLSSAQLSLEAKTRHMRDLKLAKEAAEEERRGAIALWQAEYYAAQERKRIELDSIARDVLLGYPEMDAVTASGIANIAYAEALARGFTRVVDALTIAMALAQEWYETHIFPHFTTKTITCSGCGATLELTMSDIAEHNRELNCPICGVYAC